MSDAVQLSVRPRRRLTASTLNGVAAAVAVMVLDACSMAPQFVRPEAPVAEAYPVAAGSKAGDRMAADIDWRSFFIDRRLHALIDNALANNRDLRSAALRIEEARALYNIQSTDMLPTLNGTAGISRTRTPAGLSPSGNAVTSRSYQVGVSLASFELDFFGRVRSLNDAALAQYFATEEARRALQISLVAEVAKAYLAERSFAEQSEIAKRTVDGRQTGLKLAKQRFDVGASSALDLRLSESLLQSARISLLTLNRQRAQADNALTLLTGAPLNNLPPAEPLDTQNIVTDIPAGLPSDLLARRPDIRAAEQRLRAANANIGAARAAFFPRISLTAGLGTASIGLSGLFDAGSGSWSFAPQLLLPLFDGGRNRSNLSLAEVRTSLAVTDYEKSIQVAFREVADALVARGLLDEQVDAQRLFLDAQAARLTLSEQRNQNGISSSLEVLDAQRELFAAQQSLVQVRLLRLTNAVDLYRSLGGGLTQTALAGVLK